MVSKRLVFSTVLCALMVLAVGCGKTNVFTTQQLAQTIKEGRVLRAHLESGSRVRGDLRDGSAFFCQLSSEADWPSLEALMKNNSVDLVFVSDSATPVSQAAWGVIRSVH